MLRNKLQFHGSSTESKYQALASTATKLCWLCQLLKYLGIFLSIPPKLWYDNVSALAIASNPVFHACTKHIEVDYHFIRERVIFRSNISPLMISLLISSPRVCPLIVFSFSVPKSCALRCLRFWGDDRRIKEIEETEPIG